jgi:tetratricopeptide (TPR) repeat protein
MKWTTGIVCIIFLLLIAGCGNQAERFVERGSLLRDAGQYDEALKLYRKAIAVSPNYEDAYIAIALTYDEYLHDQSNAVVAYQQYLEIAQEPIIKERAQEWLAAAQNGSDQPDRSAFSSTVALPDAGGASSAAAERRADLQLKLLKESLTLRYEGEIEKIHQQLLDAQEKLITLERENSVYQADNTYGDETLLLKQLSSNETLIAQLQTELEQQREDSSDVVKGMELLQSLVTNLQHKLQDKIHQAVLFTILNESNSLLTADCQALEGRLQRATEDRDEYKVQLDYLKQNAAGTSSTGIAVNLSPAMQVSMRSLSNTVADLTRKVNLHNKERDTFVQTVGRMRSVIDDKNGKLKALQGQVTGLKTQTVSQVDLNYYHGLVIAEKEKRVRTDKLLYERTLQLKRLQQGYAALQQNYLEEAKRRREISAYVANGMNPKSASVTRTATRTSNPQNRTTPNRIVRTATRTYTVQQGDSLLKIARKIYGDQSKWTTIFEANRSQLDRPNRLRVGQVLRMP